MSRSTLTRGRDKSRTLPPPASLVHRKYGTEKSCWLIEGTAMNERKGCVPMSTIRNSRLGWQVMPFHPSLMKYSRDDE